MMSQELKRGSKGRTNSPTYSFLKLITFFQVAATSTSPDTTAMFHAWLYGTDRDTEQPQEKETS